MMNLIKEIRFRRGLKQCQLAMDAKINISVLSKIENDWLKPTPKQQKALAKVLKLRVEEIFPPGESHDER